jgi:chromosomal replication initiation ATPase DnaA
MPESRKTAWMPDQVRHDKCFLFHCPLNIAECARQVCKKYNISLGELRSGSRKRNVVEARCSISWIAVRGLGYSGADVARYLGVSNSCVTRFVASGKKPDVDDLINKL